MPENVYTYLKFVRFKDIERWDMKSLLGNSLHFKYQECKFKKILSKTEIEWVDIEDELEYPILGVHAQGEGVYINNVSKGKSLTMKRYQKSKEMSLFYCKVRTVKGQWGIVYPEYSNSYGSSNMQYLDVAYDKIMPQYLMNLLKSNRLTSHWDKNAIGADGRHFNFDTLMNLSFPLPTIEEQRTLVSAYNNKISQSEAFEKQAAQVEQGIEDYLLSELGIKQKGYTQAEPAAINASEPQVEYVVSNRQLEDRSDTYHWGDEIKKEYKYLKFVRFKDVIEWGYDRMVGGNNKLLHSTIYPNYKLGQLLDINPTTSFSNLDGSDEISFIPMECISDKYGEWKEKRICKVNLSKGYTKFSDGDLIWARITPCMQNGKSAIVYGLENGYGCGSTEFHVIRNHNENLNIHYIHLLLRLPAVLKDAMKSFTGSAGQQRVPKSYLEQLSVPVPSLNIQNSIVEHINKQKEQIKQLRLQAESLRKEALKEFEKEIFE